MEGLYIPSFTKIPMFGIRIDFLGPNSIFNILPACVDSNNKEYVLSKLCSKKTLLAIRFGTVTDFTGQMKMNYNLSNLDTSGHQASHHRQDSASIFSCTG